MKKKEESSSPNASSQYRGVSFNSHSQKWKAVITVGRKQYFLGYYGNEVEAARAYDKAALELRGPEAPTNFRYDAGHAAALAAAARQAAGLTMQRDETDEEMDIQCASLEQLDTQTGESMESVRDVELELSAVKSALEKQAMLNAHNRRNEDQSGYQ